MSTLVRLAFALSVLAVPLALSLSSILALAAPLASAVVPVLAVALATTGTFLWMRRLTRAEEARQGGAYRYVPPSAGGSHPMGAAWDQSRHFS